MQYQMHVSPGDFSKHAGFLDALSRALGRGRGAARAAKSPAAAAKVRPKPKVPAAKKDPRMDPMQRVQSRGAETPASMDEFMETMPGGTRMRRAAELAPAELAELGSEIGGKAGLVAGAAPFGALATLDPLGTALAGPKYWLTTGVGLPAVGYMAGKKKGKDLGRAAGNKIRQAYVDRIKALLGEEYRPLPLLPG